MSGYSLHIGLNRLDPSCYIPAPAVLAGCINDANDMRSLAEGSGFMARTLLDSAATSTAVLNGLQQLARLAQPGDAVFISYSGHGGQIHDTNGDEDDGLDETWCCYDRQVLDDELNRMYAQFSSGVRILVLSDSCHSGTVVKTILAIATREALTRNPLGAEFWADQIRTPKLAPKYLPLSTSLADSRRRGGMYATVQALAGRTRAADIAAELILISGCQDNQLSSDGTGNGLFTEALKNVWDDGSFQGDHRAFHRAIVAQMPPDQTPNLLTIGPSSGFASQRPFTVDAPPAGVVPGGSSSGSGSPSGSGSTTRPTLRQGDRGDDVSYLQQKLVDDGAWLSVDGSFGPATASAVRSFQSRHALTADGIVGPATWAALEGDTGSGTGWDTGGTSSGGTGGTGSGGASGNGESSNSGGWDNGGGPTDHPSDGGWGTGTGNTTDNGTGSTGSGTGTGTADTGNGATSVRATLRRGSRGEDVVYLQKRLNAFGFYLTADGSFGPATESAVRSFQRSASLTADGVVGPATWGALG